MGALIPFLGGGHEAALPPARAALSDCLAEIASLEARTVILAGMRSKLESDFLGKVAAAERTRRALIDEGAENLVTRLRGGLEASLASLGRQAESVGAQLSGSQDQIAIVKRAIDRIDAELAEISERHAELTASKADLIAAVMREAAGESICSERATATNAFREAIIHEAAFERVTAAHRHDYVPPSRVVIAIPSLVWADAPPEEIVLAPQREIQAAAEVLGRFAAALESDALAVMDVFPPIDARPDQNVLFHELSPPEMAQVTKDYAPTNHQRPETPEIRRFATQALDAAKAALGL